MAALRLGEMPHLIADSYFEPNRGDLNPIANARNPIPNAFRESGQVESAQGSLAAAASAVANPMKQYNLAIPHSYVSVQFNNLSKWYVEKKLVKVMPYGSKPETYWEIKKFKLPPPPISSGGNLDGYAELGAEYKRADLWDAINAVPGDHQGPLMKMLQRVQEFKPNYTMNQLHALLQAANMDPDLSSSRYFIFPVYKSGDLTDPTVEIQPSTGSLPGWINPLDFPDGTPKQISSENEEDGPNTNWENIVGGKISSGQHNTVCTGAIIWNPGTGYSPCLGNLLLARQTDCYFSGQP
jgi:hypothetical protein